MYLAKFLHILGFTIWVGGMFFAHNALRPVAAVTLEPPLRLKLLVGIFTKFFMWVWIAIVLIFGSGGYMMSLMGKPPLPVTIMFVIGTVMMLIYAHIFFAPFKRLKRGVAAEDWPAAGAAMASMRKLVLVNLILGLLTICIGALGPLYY
ncbi:MAG: CopD family protein [Oxalicibacterium faecigallinarum]|uniref:Membrane protein n=1 Tax=Oxalicibacterium faecigallinarum TaxID=573741 RepID=A0A8J3AR67_9BURK|nr:CopD family protein [Oxalicibacterium faecigallinarum]MDQ7970503.1 CopD family protein [Oxalicibacterium faecigallinarum]GGI19738.1 membrane protein [Oxalicibacterium faecigallinarum]